MIDQSNQNKKSTLHERLLEQASSKNWERGPWKKSFRKKLQHEPWNQSEESHEVLEYLLKISIIPDAWRLKLEGKREGWSHPVLVLELLEIEVTNHVNDMKLYQYEQFWWLLDTTETFHLRIFRMDKYGITTAFLTEETIFHIMKYLYRTN